MAAFNPQVPEVNPLPAGGWTKPTAQPEPNLTMGTLFRDIGQTFDAAVKGVDETVKSVASDKLKPLQDLQDTYINTMQAVDPSTGQIDPAKLISKDPDPAIPPTVDKQINGLEMLSSAKASGKLSETAYLGKAYTILKSVRSQFPGYTDYIDQKAQQITGRDVANDYLKNMISDFNSLRTGQDDIKKTAIAHLGLIVNDGTPDKDSPGKVGVAQAIQHVHDETWTPEQGLEYANKANYWKYQYKIAEENFKLSQNDRTSTGIAAKEFATTSLADMKKDEWTSFTLGKGSVAELANKITMRGGDLKPEELATITSEIQRHKSIFTSSAMRFLSDPSKGKDGKPLAASMTPEEIKQTIALHSQDYDELTNLITNKDTGLAYVAAHDISTINDKTKYELLTGKNADYWRRFHAGTELGGGDSFKKTFDDWYNNQNIGNNELQLGVKMEGMSAITGMPDSKTGTKPSLLDSIKYFESKGLNAADAPKTFRALINQVDLLRDSNTPYRARENLIYYLYGPHNMGLINKIERDSTDPTTGQSTAGKFSVYGRLFSPDMVKIAKGVGDINKDAWDVFKSTGQQLFAKELYPDAVRQLRDLTTVGYGARGNVAWNPKEVKFESKDMSPPVKLTITRINNGLQSLKNIAEADGQDPNAFVLKTLQDMHAFGKGDGTATSTIEGLPEEMTQAVVRHKAHAKAEGERLKAEYATTTKDESRVSGKPAAPVSKPQPTPTAVEPQEDLTEIPQQTETHIGTRNRYRSPF